MDYGYGRSLPRTCHLKINRYCHDHTTTTVEPNRTRRQCATNPFEYAYATVHMSCIPSSYIYILEISMYDKQVEEVKENKNA